MKFLDIGILLQFILTTTAPCLAFQFQPTTTVTSTISSKVIRQTNDLRSPTTFVADSTLSIVRARSHQLQMNKNIGDGDDDDDDDDDEDYDDDEYIEDSDLGDWRSFRKTLVDSGISYDTAEQGYLDADADADADTDAQTKTSASSSSSSSSETQTYDDIVDASKGSSIERPTSVSKANEELLEKQSETLAREYKSGVWAHEAGFAEIGGLVVRLPLEAEIYKNKEGSVIGKDLVARLRESDLAGNKNTDEPHPVSMIKAQTFLWYQKAQELIQEEMSVIAGKANDRGEVDATGFSPRTMELLTLYLNNQQNWQSVCLVAKMDGSKTSAETYTLNRPMAFSLKTENLAKMVLFGATSNMIRDGRVPVSELNRYSKFLRAFEKECAIYIGGPDDQDKPAEVIHGIQGLEGAREIAPGIGIYIGGLEAAIDGVLDGRHKPLDFRFFIGRNKYPKGELDAAILSNQYQPIACARSLALKQCIQLPKPLWHEVMELCGGELREVSRLEFQKRNDLPQE